MAAIKPAMLLVLKKLLDERYVPHLPPLLGDANLGDKPEKQISRAYSAFVLQILFEISPLTSAKYVVDDYNDNGVDAIYYHEQEKTLYFLQSKLKANEQFKLSEAQSFMSGVKQLINKQFDTFNQNVKNLEDYIETALDECEQIKLIIAYTGDDISQHAKDEFSRQIQEEREDGDEQLQEDYIEFNAQKTEDSLKQEQAVKLVNSKIKIHKYRVIDQPIKTIFGIVKIDDLIKLHEKHGKNLYEKNIRYFIGVGKRGVNKAIKQTLQEEPDKFMHLNNGITLIANTIKQKSKSKDNNTTREFEVLGMSVVNGAQTIASAAQFKNDNPEVDLSAAQVLLTLINTGINNDFHKQVTKSRNLQNPVDLSDFAALDENQERLRKEIALYGIEYHYRPQRILKLGIPVITIEVLSKALACLSKDIRYVGRLKTEPSQFNNIDSVAYKEIFTDQLTGIYAINAARVFNEIHQLLNTADRSSLSPEKLVYRHCLYALANILMKRMKKRIEGPVVLEPADIRRLISAPFDVLRQKFADQYRIDGVGSAHHAFFKRISDTAKLTQNVTIADMGVAAEPSVIALKGRLDLNDPHNQALTDYLSGKAVQI